MPEFSDLSGLLKCKKLQDILNSGRTLFSNPIILTDLTHKVLAITNEPELTDPNWLAINESGGIPLALTNYGAINDCYRSSMETGGPVFDVPHGGGILMLRKALTINGKLVGYLDSPCYTEEISGDEQVIFDLIGDLCVARMQSEQNYFTPPENLLEFFIADLMTGRITDKHLIEERFRYYHWNLKAPLRILTVRPRELKENMRKSNISDYCNELSAKYPMLTVFEYGQDIKIIVSGRGKLTLGKESANEFAEYLKCHNLCAGASRAFENVQELYTFNQQAEKAMQLGKLLHPDKNLYLYDEYSVFHVLENCARTEDLMRFCHSATFTLAQYDKKHETNLLESLQAYLTHHKNVAEAAAVLYIHRNTMNYRINKINDLLQINLDDTEVTFNLLFSYHILEYYSAAVIKDSEEQRRRRPRIT